MQHRPDQPGKTPTPRHCPVKWNAITMPCGPMTRPSVNNSTVTLRQGIPMRRKPVGVAEVCHVDRH